MNNNLVLRFFVPLVFFILSCNFESPQSFETPSWNLPLTMPLIDQEYSLSGLSSPVNQISIDSLTNTFVISIDTSIISYDERITIGDELFFVPESSAPTPEISIPSISSDLFDIDVDPIAIGISLSDLGGSFSDLSCLGSQFMEQISSTTNQTIELFTDDAISNIDMIESLHYLTIGEGLISADIENSLPWQIDRFDITIYDVSADTIWTQLNFSDISGISTRENNLNDKPLPGLISIETSYNISGDTINSGYSSVCSQIISENIKIEYAECSNLDFADTDCAACIATGLDSNFSPCTVIDSTNCSNQIAPNSFSIGLENYDLEDTEYIWLDNECFLAVPGVTVTDSDALSIEINFEISSVTSLTAHIEIEEVIDNPLDFSLGNGVSIIKAHMANKGLDNPDTNRIVFNIENNLFSDINFDFGINEFVLIENGDSLSFLSENIIASGESSELNYNMSDYYILNTGGGEIEQINLLASIGLSDENATILFDYDYSFGIDAVIKTFELDAVNVKLEEFATPDLPVASIPAGFTDFELPTLSFNLIFYNQINVPLTLILDLEGVTGDDKLSIHVEPSLAASSSESITDTTIISFYADTMKVIHNSNVVSTPLVNQNNPNIPVSIFDLFGYDEISISGRAALDGEGSLERGKSVWGDVSIRIEPLTLILPDDINIIAQSTDFTALPRSTADQINNGIVESRLYMNLENHTPFAAQIGMLISNSNYFPLCVDSLVSGTIENQSCSQGCLDDIVSNLNPNFISIDSTLENQFIHMSLMNEQDTFFYGRLMSLDLPEPENINEQGFVLESGFALDSISMGDMEIKWLTRNEDMYISPKISILSSDSDVNNSGWRTFQTTDYLGVNSYITFVLNTGGLLGE